MCIQQAPIYAAKTGFFYFDPRFSSLEKNYFRDFKPLIAKSIFIGILEAVTPDPKNRLLIRPLAREIVFWNPLLRPAAAGLGFPISPVSASF